MVEGAIVLTITLSLIFTIAEYGRLVMCRQLMNNAAREGARYALVSTGSKTTADVLAAVDQHLGDPNLDNLSVQVFKVDAAGANTGAWTDAAFGEGICVQIDGDFRPVIPVISRLPDPLHLTVRSVLRSEAN